MPRGDVGRKLGRNGGRDRGWAVVLPVRGYPGVATSDVNAFASVVDGDPLLLQPRAAEYDRPHQLLGRDPDADAERAAAETDSQGDGPGNSQLGPGGGQAGGAAFGAYTGGCVFALNEIVRGAGVDERRDSSPTDVDSDGRAKSRNGRA